MGQILSSLGIHAENDASASPPPPCVIGQTVSSKDIHRENVASSSPVCETSLQNVTGQTLSRTGIHAENGASASPSSPGKYHVFVSHAGEDKQTIAIPLRDMLSRRGVTAFVDEKDIRPGGAAIAEMTCAMENADIAVIVLSPEFVAKEWPMKELLFFLHRRESAPSKGESLPVIIPVFYRLSVADMHTEPDLERRTADGRSLYRATRFFERRDEGAPEADVEIIRHALRALHGIMGVVNKYHASNEESSMPSRRLLLKDICEKISEAIAEHKISTIRNEEIASTSDDTKQFRRHFHTEQLRNVVLDFDSLDENGEPLTYEGRIKHRVMNRDSNSDQIIAILGIGGVGKSTILKALVNEEDLRESFCDGIHLISLGMDATVGTLVQELSRVLRDSGAKEAVSKLQGESRLGVAVREAVRDALKWFNGKSCLFLIDDVWTEGFGLDLFAHVVKLGCAGLQSTVMLTTRESEIASVAHTQESIFKITPREHLGKESRDILFSHAGMKRNYSDSMQGILEICAGLPVSLAAAGKGVKMMVFDMGSRDFDVWTEYLKVLDTCREQLIRENVGEYGNLYITFRVSIALLEGREAERLGFETRVGFGEMHRRLCVLRKQDKVPMSMLRNLWELSNESEARVVAMQFSEVGLAELKFELVRTDSSVATLLLGMHDSIHDYAVSEARRHNGVEHAHQVFLDGCSRSHRDLVSMRGGWLDVWVTCRYPNTYLYNNLLYHLKKAGYKEEWTQICNHGFLETVTPIEFRNNDAQRREPIKAFDYCTL